MWSTVAVVTQPGNSVGQVQASTLLKTQPMVAKVMTNAQGQPVISMESLLTHQKQLHPQGNYKLLLLTVFLKSCVSVKFPEEYVQDFKHCHYLFII